MNNFLLLFKIWSNYEWWREEYFLEKDEIRFDHKLNINYYVDFNDFQWSTEIYTEIKDYDKLNEEEIKELNNSLKINDFNEDNKNINFSEINEARMGFRRNIFGISNWWCIIYDIDSNSDEEED